MRAENQVHQEQADQSVAGLASVLVPFAERVDRQPVTAGPAELPELVQKLSWLARESLGFGARAMTGADAVAAQEWWRLGDVYVALGRACQQMATLVAVRDVEDGGRL